MSKYILWRSIGGIAHNATPVSWSFLAGSAVLRVMVPQKTVLVKCVTKAKKICKKGKYCKVRWHNIMQCCDLWFAIVTGWAQKEVFESLALVFYKAAMENSTTIKLHNDCISLHYNYCCLGLFYSTFFP